MDFLPGDLIHFTPPLALLPYFRNVATFGHLRGSAVVLSYDPGDAERKANLVMCPLDCVQNGGASFAVGNAYWARPDLTLSVVPNRWQVAKALDGCSFGQTAVEEICGRLVELTLPVGEKFHVISKTELTYAEVRNVRISTLTEGVCAVRPYLALSLPSPEGFVLVASFQGRGVYDVDTCLAARIRKQDGFFDFRRLGLCHRTMAKRHLDWYDAEQMGGVASKVAVAVRRGMVERAMPVSPSP